MAYALSCVLLPSEKASLRGEDQRCSICTEKFETGKPGADKYEQAVKLTCQHIFGSKCIDAWAKSHDKCPICRNTPVVRPGMKREAVKEVEEEEENDNDDDGHWMSGRGEGRLAINPWWSEAIWCKEHDLERCTFHLFKSNLTSRGSCTISKLCQVQKY